jgi:hypothetical protein
MAERENKVPHEVAATRLWMEREIIDRGFCPPLSRLSKRHTKPDKTINWESMGSAVVIDSYLHEDPTDIDLDDKITKKYIMNMWHSLTDTVPYTNLTILPQFSSNELFDKFVQKVLTQAKTVLMHDPAGQEMAELAYEKAKKETDLTFEDVSTLEGETRKEALANNVLDPIFAMQQLYGREITEEESVKFKSYRGPVQRERVIHRAPYYGILINNPYRAGDLTYSLNRPAVEKNNTRVILSMDIVNFNKRIDGYRDGTEV